MTIGKVIGTITATIKHPTYEGRKLLLVAYVGPDIRPLGKTVIAVDTVQAGIGDFVLVTKEGNSTRQILGRNAGPVLELVTAVIDRITWSGSKEE